MIGVVGGVIGLGGSICVCCGCGDGGGGGGFTASTRSSSFSRVFIKSLGRFRELIPSDERRVNVFACAVCLPVRPLK